MSDKSGCEQERYHKSSKHTRGPSSYGMHDAQLVFNALKLKCGDRFLDLGCGPGNYALQAARLVGDAGIVYALDKAPQMIAGLAAEARNQRIKNIRAMVCDITEPLPLQDHCVDVCLMATVLHIPTVAKGGTMLFTEIHRVLKPGGRLAIIECKKEDMPFGPPKDMRWSPAEVGNAVVKYGFKKLNLVDLGYNYMLQFEVKQTEY